MGTQAIEISLTPEQQAAFDSTATVTRFYGRRAAGKTFLAQQWVRRFVREHQRATVIVFVKNLDLIHWQWSKCFEKDGATYSVIRARLNFPNGANVYLCVRERPERMLGLRPDAIVDDEADAEDIVFKLSGFARCPMLILRNE